MLDRPHALRHSVDAGRDHEEGSYADGRFLRKLPQHDPVEALGVARRVLEESDDSIAAVASACGFGTAETMRRSFLRAMRVGPTEYRRRFRTEAA